MSAGLRSCLLSVPGPDKNRQVGLGRPAWSCHHGHLLTAIITSAPASHRYSIQTQLRALHVPLQPAITNTPANGFGAVIRVGFGSAWLSTTSLSVPLLPYHLLSLNSHLTEGL
ncbi:hypothetical protein F7725_022930 [Dissostichus mawsoni]|uniref:Uncharacterized protein n=2 Tax=Dissostichus TaxID=36199 RepID=A0A7J5YZ98_DISMA|nr:hypothetical protein F7725_022930 [Dissostichus mawsoni]KAK1887400.1 AP-1 complex subunit gamma-2 [Dissostichus eleginoides]